MDLVVCMTPFLFRSVLGPFLHQIKQVVDRSSRHPHSELHDAPQHLRLDGTVCSWRILTVSCSLTGSMSDSDTSTAGMQLHQANKVVIKPLRGLQNGVNRCVT